MRARWNTSPSFIAVLTALLFLVHSTSGQITAPNCDAGWDWASNSQGNNPCQMAATLSSPCSNGQFTLHPLQPGNVYLGVSVADGRNTCRCNTVTYSLISACTACQGNNWSPWTVWAFNCTQVPTDGTYPQPIPDGIKIPNWAYLNVTQSGNWNNLTAFNTGDSPESFAGAGPSSSSPSPTSTSTSASHSGSHTGAIAGGVVGGVVGVAIIGGLLAFFLIRRRRAQAAPSKAYTDGGTTSEMRLSEYDGPMVAVPFTPETPRKYYDPSDPSTFPTSPSSPPFASTIHTTNDTSIGGGVNDSPSHPGHGRTSSAYTGFPEV